MSTQKNQPEDVPALLNRLRNIFQTIRIDEDPSLAIKINKIDDDLRSMSDQVLAVKQWAGNLLHQFSELDRRQGISDSCAIDIGSMVNQIDADINRAKTLLSQFHANSGTDPVPGRHTWQHRNGFRQNNGNERQELSELEEKIIENATTNPTVKNLQVSYDRLEHDRLDLRICLLFLAIFPENAVIKKRPLIYWWIGEGLIETEEEGEKIFDELLKLELIIPRGNGKGSIVNMCQIHPWIRYMLITMAQNAQLFDFHKGIPLFRTSSSRRACLIDGRRDLSEEDGSRYETLRTIFNVNESYVSVGPEWLARLSKLAVLQLGRWQDSPTHHIEVQSELFLQGLRAQKHLKYLSLRGISRITAIPSSIVELPSLEILDLKACHNLETLPDDISSLRKLTHLDVSECYLLESMPKGLDKLASLQVLKGFIIGNSEKTPCRIGDLRKLPNLKRLSVHIGSEALIQPGEFDKLKDLESVRCLKISWGVVSQRGDPIQGRETEDQVNLSISFPPLLEKLDLEGVPRDRMSEWLKPSKLRQLMKLYIKGGELRSLDHGQTDMWDNVKILRLKYMKNPENVWPKLKDKFPSLEYVQIIESKESKRGDASETPGVETINFEWSKQDSEGSRSH